METKNTAYGIEIVIRAINPVPQNMASGNS
jgi:hypothetical protein